MKKNMFICSLGILLVIYSVATSFANPYSSSSSVLGCILIAYSVRNKFKRSAAKTDITSFN